MAPGYSSERLTIFLATGFYPAPLQPDADEFLQIETLSIAEAYRLAESGAIQDGKTLAALLLARPYLQELPEVVPDQPENWLGGPTMEL